MDNSLGNKEIMARNIQYYMDLYQKDRRTICNDLKISYTTFTDWVKGNTYPRIDKIELLARYFGVAKSDLVEEHVENASSDTPTLTPDETGLLTDYRKLNDTGKECARDRVSELTEISRYTDKREELSLSDAG